MTAATSIDPESSPLALASSRVFGWLRAGELTDIDAEEGWWFSERVPDVAAAHQQFRTYARPIEEVRSYTEVTHAGRCSRSTTPAAGSSTSA